MTRHTQDRSRSRHDLLIDTALALYATHGRSGVTHRAVAQAADMPLSTIGYYFGTVDGLLAEAITNEIRSWADLPTGISDEDDLMSILAGIVEAWTTEEQSQRTARWRIFLAAADDPEVLPVLRETLESSRRRLDELLHRQGVQLPDIGLLFQIGLFGASAVMTGSGGESADIARVLGLMGSIFIDPETPGGQALLSAFAAIGDRSRADARS